MQKKIDKLIKEIMLNSSLEIKDASFTRNLMILIVKHEYQRKKKNIIFWSLAILFSGILLCYLTIAKYNLNPHSLGLIAGSFTINLVGFLRTYLQVELDNLQFIFPLLILLLLKRIIDSRLTV